MTVALCRDVIGHPSEEGFLFSNVFLKTHVEVNAAGMALLGLGFSPRSLEELRDFIRSQPGVAVRDRTTFSNLNGLLADPSNLVREGLPAEAEPPGWITQPDEILLLLRKRFLLIPDEKEYQEFCQKKRNLFDDQHHGNFHQQLGVELRVKKRVDADRWWLDQKFSGGGRDLKDNLYRFIQLHFWESYFCGASLQGQRVLDVGCGPGFYSRFLAGRGAHVLGVDPNAAFLEAARQIRSTGGVEPEYRLADVGSGGAFSELPDEEFDWIIFQDALLFYFVPTDERKPADRARVLSELKRVLKRDGTLLVVDPHGVFWLSPWLGRPERPFTVVTEYARKRFGVTPTLSQMSGAFFEAGFWTKRILELYPSPEAAEKDPRGWHFSSQFPLWWCFELVKSP